MRVIEYRTELAQSEIELAPGPHGSWGTWAIFLGVSWTWCIGMFLPVLLMRDYGPLAWVAFAIPNVLGAAAMGTVLRNADSSRALVASHLEACAAFSLITIAFHVFFIVWLHLLFPGISLLAVAAAAACFVARADRATCVVALAISLVCFSWFALQREYDRYPWDWAWGGPRMRIELLKLWPVMWFGFLCCPYLDLTFHRARQSTSAEGGRWAFLFGFAGVFLAMIAFTFLYAQWLPVERFLPRGSHASVRRYSLLNVVAVHIAVQAGVTMAWHARSLIASRPNRRHATNWMLAATIASGALVGFAAVRYDERIRVEHLVLGEFTYRVFMGFYGLVFPAYVWLCMVPGRGRIAPPRKRLIVFAAAVLIAAPMFWMGFIVRELVWLLPGVAVVLLARLFIRGSARLPSASSPGTTAPSAPGPWAT